MKMMLRLLFWLTIVLVFFTGWSRQYNYNPVGMLAIADRNSIRTMASGLPHTRGPNTDRALPINELREIARQANGSVPMFANGPASMPRPKSTSFPFGPQLLSTARARSIGRTGQVFLEAARQVRQRNPGSAPRAAFTPISTPSVVPGLECPFNEPIQCNPSSPYRTITGVCNNLHNPRWGSSNTPFERITPSVYNDGLSEPRSESVLTGKLPLPRVISTAFHAASSPRTLDMRFTQMTMEFGQFVSHDCGRFAPSTDDQGSELGCCEDPPHNNEELGCLPIEIPENDPFFSKFNRRCMEFVRALATPPLNCQIGPREQLNQETAYLDASVVYGSTDELSNELRLKKGGLLKWTPSADGELLPDDPEMSFLECRSQSGRSCFKAGDARVNEQPALMSMHTIWLREHNRVARALSQLNPWWTDEKLYQEARRIVSAEFQHIVYDEFLPVIVGDQIARAFDFPAKKFGYNSDYDVTFNAQIRASFSVAGYRFGHSLVQEFFTKNLKFENHFLRPDTLYEPSRGPSYIIEELFSLKQQKCDRLISHQLTNTLFQQIPGGGIDLAATNIHRGRDFGIPSYNTFRVLCGLSHVTHFGTGQGGLVDHTDLDAFRLAAIYKHVDDIDLWTAGVSERIIPGAVVGPTMACIVGRQFFLLKKGDRFFYENNDRYAKFPLSVSERIIPGAVVGPTMACIVGRQFFLLKKGDRFFYENNDRYAKFPLKQLDEIRKTSLARIICDNTRTTAVQREVFRYEDYSRNPKVSCYYIPSVDLREWSECQPVNGGWSAWTRRTWCFLGYTFQFRICNNPTPNACGRPCSGPSFRFKFCGSFRSLEGPIEAAMRIAPRGWVLFL